MEAVYGQGWEGRGDRRKIFDGRIDNLKGVAYDLSYLPENKAMVAKRRRKVQTSRKTYKKPRRTVRRKKTYKKRKAVTVSKVRNIVKRVLDQSDVFGNFHAIHSVILRQTDINRYGTISTDASGQILDFFTPQRIRDVEAILFKGKTWATASFDNETGNFNVNDKSHVIQQSANFELHSTSQHVTHVEMYVCHPKKDTQESAAQLWVKSFNNVSTLYGGTFNVGDNRQLGSTYRESNLLNEYYSVKRMNYKFQPGQTRSFKLRGPSGRTYNWLNYSLPASTVAAPDLSAYAKGNGSVQVFFRVRNEMTIGSIVGVVSGNNLAAGGIAVQVQRHYRMRCPQSATEALTQDVYAYFTDLQPTPGTANDLAMANPISNIGAPQ